MKKDKVMKIVMSAAVMASVAAAPVRAEDGEEFEEAKEVQAVNAEAESLPECGESETAGMEEECVVAKEGEEEQEKEQRFQTAGTACQAYEAVYRAHTSVSEGPGVVKWQRRVANPPQEYGPHCVSLLQEEAETAEQDMLQEPAEETPSYTEEDLYILAHAICGEGQCYPDDEQLYIGSVILNRRDHGAYPDTIKGVVFQKGQYACTWDGNYYREPTEANWRNARWLLENGSILPGNVVYQAGFRQGSGLYLQTRYHKYCYRS